MIAEVNGDGNQDLIVDNSYPSRTTSRSASNWVMAWAPEAGSRQLHDPVRRSSVLIVESRSPARLG